MSAQQPADTSVEQPVQENGASETATADDQPVRERGGPKGRDPTRYGDWEKNGRCIDF